MRIVNKYYIYALIGGIDDGAECYYPAITSMNSDDELQLSRLMQAVVLPDYYRLDATSQATTKLTLAYYLKNRPALLAECLDNLLTPMPDAEDKDLFFRVLWRELYPNEDVNKVDVSDCVEVDDCEATLQMRYSAPDKASS